MNKEVLKKERRRIGPSVPVSFRRAAKAARLGFSILAAAAVTFLAAISCGPAQSCPDGKVCLRYMAWGNPEQLDVERQMIDRFNQENPDVHVDLFMAPGSAYLQKAILMLASRTAPDVLRIDHYNFPQLVKKNYFTDLTDLAKQDPEYRAGDFFDTAIQEGTVGDRLYGLNALYGGILMYYNKDLIKQAGLEDPYVLFKRGEWTWDKFREYALAIAKHDDKGRLKTAGLTIPGFPIPYVVVWGYGGELMSPDMKQSRVNEEGTVKAYQFLADLVWKDNVAPTPAEGANNAFTFDSGKVGMVFDWMGMSPRFRKVVKSFDWDVCPPPKGPAGFVGIVKGNQLVVSSNSKHPKEAWRFIRFLTGVEGETRLCAEIRRAFPTRVGVAKSSAYLASDRAPHQITAFVESVEAGKMLPINDRWSEWTQIFNQEIDNLMSGRERDARVVLTRAKTKIDAALAEDPGY